MALEFKETFTKGYWVTSSDIPIIMQCKNIDFGHVSWAIYSMYSYVLISDFKFMMHLVENIIDITIHSNNNGAHNSFIFGVMYHSDMEVLKYVINNRCINKATLVVGNKYHISSVRILLINNLLKLVNYLDNISLNRFTGYYNLEKYYHVIPIMLLVTRVQTVLPNV